MAKKTNELAESLLSRLSEEGPRLEAISDSDASTRPTATPGWSRKQELGHLIDSAANNRVRFATAGLATEFSGPTYDGDGWVRLGGYETMNWRTITGLWRSLNEALAVLILNIPDDKLTVPCQIGAGPSVTLGFLIEDYILHMQHHLDHILAREVSTSYPGAAMGV